MTTLGWIFMAISLSFVWGLVLWCYSRILRLPPDKEVARPAKEFHSA